MKNTRKILVALCLAVVLLAVLAVSAFAAGATSVKTGKSTKFEDYANIKLMLLDDMESGANTSNAATACGVHTKKTGKNVVEVKTDGKGAPYVYAANGTTSSKSYVTVIYDNKESGALYLHPRFKNYSAIQGTDETPVNGFVSEFDIGTLSGNMAGVTIDVFNAAGYAEGAFRVLTYSATNGVAKLQGVKNGTQDYTGKSITSDAGKWLHVTVLYDPADGYVTVYGNKSRADRDGNVERILLGRFDSVATSNNGLAVYPLQFRIGNQGATTGNFSLDNILFYQSTTVCDPEYLSRFNDAQLFAKYVELFDSTTATSVKKYQAYELVRDTYVPMFSGTSDSTASAALAKYNTFVSTKLAAVKAEAEKENAKSFNNLVKELMNMKRGMANIADRQSKVSAIDSFLASTSSLIARDTSDFETAEMNYGTWSQYLTADIDVRTFKNRMDRFKDAKSYGSSSAMQRHYDVAKEFAQTILDIAASNYANFGNSSEVAEIKKAKTLYESAPAEIAKAFKTTNSERFIKIMALLEGTTETDWAADNGVMRNQWYLARTIILEGNFNSSVSGFSSAKSRYDVVNAYFWSQLQDEHAAVLSAKLDFFDDPSANYIDKAGVCTFVDNYLAKNEIDIDPGDTRIAELKSRNETYKTQLDQLEIDYAAALNQHTVEFKYKMDEIASLTGYANLKPAFDAASELYYSMNVALNDLTNQTDVTNDQLQAAIKDYDALRTWLLNVEVMSTAFIEQMAVIDETASDKDARYQAILNCFGCEEFLDDTFVLEERKEKLDENGDPALDEDGNPTYDVVTKKVIDYKSKYDSLKSDYIAKTTLANEESALAIDAMCATRKFCGVDDQIKYVQDNLK